MINNFPCFFKASKRSDLYLMKATTDGRKGRGGEKEKHKSSKGKKKAKKSKKQQQEEQQEQQHSNVVNYDNSSESEGEGALCDWIVCCCTNYSSLSFFPL